MAKKAAKQPKEYELELRKVRDTMKRLNLKKLNKDAVQKIADELGFELSSKQRAGHLRGKMLASIAQWDKH